MGDKKDRYPWWKRGLIQCRGRGQSQGKGTWPWKGRGEWEDQERDVSEGTSPRRRDLFSNSSLFTDVMAGDNIGDVGVTSWAGLEMARTTPAGVRAMSGLCSCRMVVCEKRCRRASSGADTRAVLAISGAIVVESLLCGP